MTMATDDIAEALDDVERWIERHVGGLLAQTCVERIHDAREALNLHITDDQRIEDENAELHRRIEAIEDASGESFEDSWIAFMARRRDA